MPEQTNGKLVSWKEIAAYLRCDVRTVQRWELEFGLPVHRPPGAKGHRVFAFPTEIDEWLTSHDHEGVERGQRDDSNGDKGSDSSATAPRTVRATVADSTPAAVIPTDSITPPKRGPLLGWLAAVAIVLAALAGVSVWWERRDVEIGAVTFGGQQVLAWSNGKVAWSYDLGQPLRILGPQDGAPRAQIQDLKGDGTKEIVVPVPMLLFDHPGPSTDALYCFTSRGKLLWRQVFDNRVHFGGEDCGPRWEIHTLMVTGQGATRSVWCTICSYPTSVSVLLKIDPAGNATQHFVNYGHLNAVNEVHAPSGSYVLAGGVNNEYNCAMLAVLGESGVSGRSPQTAAFSDCDSCPAGEPYRYLLFPRSEVSDAAGKPYNSVFNILVTGPRAQVMTVEIPAGYTPADWGLYDLSDDYTPRTRFFSDNYLADHRKFSAEGKINHAVEACPERFEPGMVRVWSPKDGWKEVKLPPIAAKTKG